MDTIEKARKVKKTSFGRNFTEGELSSWIRRIEKHSIASKKLSKFRENFDFEDLKKFWEVAENSSEDSKLKKTSVGKKLTSQERVTLSCLVQTSTKLEKELTSYVIQSEFSLKENKEFYKFLKSL